MGADEPINNPSDGDDAALAGQVCAALGSTMLVGLSVCAAWLQWWAVAIGLAALLLGLQAATTIRRRRDLQALRHEVGQLRGTVRSGTALLVLHAVSGGCHDGQTIAMAVGEVPDLDGVLADLVAVGLLAAQWVEQPGTPTWQRFALTRSGLAVVTNLRHS